MVRYHSPPVTFLTFHSLYRLSDSEERNSLFSRIVSTAEVSGELPLSNVNHLWQQRSWRQSLTAPLDEFIQLNLSPVVL